MKSRTLARACAASLSGLVGAAAVLAVVAAPAAAEGPDAIRANPAFSANQLPRNDDGSTGAVPIGFTADFFGTQYSSVFVNNNGNITFDGRLSAFTPFALDPHGTKIIAPFFADVDTRSGASGITAYGYGTGQVDGHLAFGVNWVNVGYYNFGTDRLNSFQLVMIQREDTGSPNNFDIELNYDKVQWDTGEASGGASARAGYSSGTGEAFQLPGSGVNNAFLDSNTSSGLTHNSLDSSQLGRYVFQVRNGVVLPVNEAPVAAAGDDVTGDEGSSMILDGSGSTDADGDALTYAWNVTGDVGNDAGADCVIADPTAASTTMACDDDGSYTADLTVSDGVAETSDSALVTVGNVAPAIGTPTLTGSSGTACQAGNSVDLSVDVTDAGANDVGDLSGTVVWGDGTSDPYTGSSYVGNHTYAPGTYTVQVHVDDADGGTHSKSLTGAVSHLYEAGGLMAPVNADGSSVFKRGSTIPLKVQITDCDGVLVSSLAPDVDLVKVDQAVPDGTVNEVVSSSAANDGDNMRWADDRYMFNLSTKRSQFCSGNMCADGDLTAGVYRVSITDSAANGAFAPVVTEFSLR